MPGAESGPVPSAAGGGLPHLRGGRWPVLIWRGELRGRGSGRGKSRGILNGPAGGCKVAVCRRLLGTSKIRPGIAFGHSCLLQRVRVRCGQSDIDEYTYNRRHLDRMPCSILVVPAAGGIKVARGIHRKRSKIEMKEGVERFLRPAKKQLGGERNFLADGSRCALFCVDEDEDQSSSSD